MTKTLAILGFVAIIILIVWLAVKIVAFIPGAFSSLASIADSVYNQNSDRELVVSTRNSVVNSGEAFTISWTDMGGNGTYEFVYQCADGVSLDIRKGSGVVEAADCNTTIELGTATEIDVLVNTEKERFTDVEYAIYYVAEGVEAKVTNSVVTIVNASIPTGVAVDTDTDTMTEPEPTPTTPTPSTPAVTTPTAPSTPTTPTPLTAGQPEVVQYYYYQYPVSDPHGYVDLAVRFLGVGTIDHDVFVPQPVLVEDQRGAIQFEIMNVGSKTTDEWEYEAELPGGQDYESGEQDPLQPGERAILTIGFAELDRRGFEDFSVEVDAEGDVESDNDYFNWRVEVIR